MLASTKEVHRGATRSEEKTGLLSNLESRVSRIGFIVSLMLCAFFVGLALSWTTVRAYRNERDDLLRRAGFTTIQMELAAAALNAEEGRFEEARLNASNFYRDLRDRYDTDDSLQAPRAREEVRTILSRRDEVIFLLGRGDTSAARILADGFFKLRSIDTPQAAEEHSGD